MPTMRAASSPAMVKNRLPVSCVLSNAQFLFFFSLSPRNSKSAFFDNFNLYGVCLKYTAEVLPRTFILSPDLSFS